ncbi:MAG: proline dehydrogenase family protein [Deltaproteobacteria bacterium]|nr:proline dehydrogenase family protein [Deltaproteobacteria bacterium]
MKSLLLLFARRYIAGTGRQDAIRVALGLNKAGIGATIDNLGENVKNASEANDSVKEYLGLLDDIQSAGADSTISLKLTHLGLDLSKELAFKNAETIIKKAFESGNSVRLDMEGSEYTQRTIETFLELRQKYPNVGIAIQSSLLRSRKDARMIAEKSGSIRLVKGAYKEPPEVAFQDKKEVDASFEAIMKELLLSGTRPAIATHDERLINEAKRFAADKNLSKNSFDFEMLLGIKRKLQIELAAEGYKVRVYIPYGRNWLPYTIRRLRERKENIWFVVKNIFER